MGADPFNPADAGGATIAVQRPLLRWYDRYRRDLPWRPTPQRPPDPYHVLVSEAMLQQTQVATVIGYFHRFIAAFPTLGSLAAADEQRVLRLWQGLGYYRRARHLHAAAKIIAARHAGRVPDTVQELLTLPGIGRYSAGAIASIAYDRPAPILDGNVARLLTRLHGIDRPADEPAVKKQLWTLAQSLVPRQRAGDFNQAMMELGALVCTPRQPTCTTCPLRRSCATRGDALPLPRSRTPPTNVTHTVIVVRRGDRYLFEQRDDKGLWAGLWQSPTAETPVDPIDWIAERFHLTIADPQPLLTFTHQTTHRTIRFRAMLAEVQRGRLRPAAGQWRSLRQLDDLPLPNPQRRVLLAMTAPPAAGSRSPPTRRPRVTTADPPASGVHPSDRPSARRSRRR